VGIVAKKLGGFYGMSAGAKPAPHLSILIGVILSGLKPTELPLSVERQLQLMEPFRYLQ
jgi:hypothetical protein